MTRRLYVGGFSVSVEAQEIKDAFARAGANVVDVELRTNENGRSKGFAYVNVADEESAEKCIKLYNRTSWRGGKLRVEIASLDYMDRLKQEWAERDGISSNSTGGEAGSSAEGAEATPERRRYLRLRKRGGEKALVVDTQPIILRPQVEPFRKRKRAKLRSFKIVDFSSNSTTSGKTPEVEKSLKEIWAEAGVDRHSSSHRPAPRLSSSISPVPAFESVSSSDRSGMEVDEGVEADEESEEEATEEEEEEEIEENKESVEDEEEEEGDENAENDFSDDEDGSQSEEESEEVDQELKLDAGGQSEDESEQGEEQKQDEEDGLGFTFGWGSDDDDDDNEEEEKGKSKAAGNGRHTLEEADNDMSIEAEEDEDDEEEEGEDEEETGMDEDAGGGLDKESEQGEREEEPEVVEEEDPEVTRLLVEEADRNSRILSSVLGDIQEQESKKKPVLPRKPWVFVPQVLAPIPRYDPTNEGAAEFELPMQSQGQGQQQHLDDDIALSLEEEGKDGGADDDNKESLPPVDADVDALTDIYRQFRAGEGEEPVPIGAQDAVPFSFGFSVNADATSTSSEGEVVDKGLAEEERDQVDVDKDPVSAQQKGGNDDYKVLPWDHPDMPIAMWPTMQELEASAEQFFNMGPLTVAAGVDGGGEGDGGKEGRYHQHQGAMSNRRDRGGAGGRGRGSRPAMSESWKKERQNLSKDFKRKRRNAQKNSRRNKL